MCAKNSIFSVIPKTLFVMFVFGTIVLPINLKAADISTQLGFKRLDDKSTPLFLNLVAQATFEIIVPSAESPQDIRFFDLNSDEFKKFEDKKNTLPETLLSKHERVVIDHQIEFCRRQKNESNCGLLLNFERASAFIAGGDGSYLLTNAHVVNRFLQLIAKNENKSVLDLLKSPQWVPIFIFDQSGNLIIDPYVTAPTLVKFGAPSVMAFFTGSGWYGDDSDYVVIQFSKSIGTPLKIAKAITVGESLFHLGFAACTGCGEAHNTTDPKLNDDRKESGNSDGKTLYWTPPGPFVNLEQASLILTAPLKSFEGSHKDNWVFFSSDSQVGMSGGPIVNDKGEVVGVFAGSKPIMQNDGSMSVLSRGVRPPEFDKAKSAEQ